MKVLTFLFALTINSCVAQVISGTVLDSNTKKPLPFTGVGISHKAIGTVCDEHGYFSLDISEASKTDTLQFSSLGYKNLDIPVNSPRIKATSFKLLSKVKNIKEIVVKPGTTKVCLSGNRVHKGMIMSGFNSNMLGTEMGTVIKYRKKNPGLIRNVNFNLAKNIYDSVLFKINIYNMTDSGVGESILQRPIYLEPFKKRGTLTLDITNYSVYINNDVLLCLELLQISKKQDKVMPETIKLWFYSSLFNSPSYWRKAAEDNWEKFPANGGVGFWAAISYKK